MSRILRLVLTLFLLSSISLAQVSASQLGDIAKRLGLGANNLSDTKINAGLKQALQIGAENSVKLVGRKDGYFANNAIKILMPKNLQPLEKGLRMVGYGPKIDSFVLSMNRSAEAAAPAARTIFVAALPPMSIADPPPTTKFVPPPSPACRPPPPATSSLVAIPRPLNTSNRKPLPS